MIYLYDTGFVSISGNYLTWKIYNFFSLPLNEESEIRSKQFVYGNSRYCLYVWPRGHKAIGSEGWFGICLYKYDAPGLGDSVQFSILSGSAGTIKSCTIQCSENKLFRADRFMEWSDFKTLRHTIAPNGCLNVVCRLLMENDLRSYDESYDNSETCMHTVYEPPPEYQCGSHRSPNPLSLNTSLNSLEANITTIPAPDVNYGSPTTSNPPYAATFLENSFEYSSESTESEKSDFRRSYSATGETGRNSFRSSLRSLNTVYVKNKPEVKDVPEKITSKSSVSPLKDQNSSEVVSLTDDPSNAENPCPNQSENPSASAGLKTLSQHLKNLYLEGKNYDMTISMEGNEFKVLKAILMARSPVFVKLLSKDNGEDTSSIITIDPFDACDAAVFHDFLLYIYSGEIENLPDKNIYGLYCAACKFEMKELKEECTKHLQNSISIDTITDIFRSADSNGSELIDMAVVFLAKNMEVIMNTNGWKQFMRQEPDRAIEYHLKALKIGYTKTIE